MSSEAVISRAADGRRPSAEEALALADAADLPSLIAAAGAVRDHGHGTLVSYSRKVFIPLTHLCRDVCHYCTFAQPPRRGRAAFLSPEQVLDIVRAGARAGCHEALFTLGDKPELRYRAAREELTRLGHDTTLSYLAEMAGLVLRETGLLPHLNPGVLTREDIDRLRPVSVSQGIMLESASPRLLRRGGPHFGSPDKDPAVRLATIAAAGEAAVPFTSGILIGIGETRRERVEALLALRDLHDRWGHVQEIIIQNFRAKPGTRMADAAEPDLAEHLWTIAMARLIFGAEMNIQAPPNLMPQALEEMIAAGINDWGGVSPVTPDHVNPEAPWPALDRLAARTAAAGKTLVERLAIYPAYALEPPRWLDPKLHTPVLRAIDAQGFARPDSWIAGAGTPVPYHRPHPPIADAMGPTLSRIAGERGSPRALDPFPLSSNHSLVMAGLDPAISGAAPEIPGSSPGMTIGESGPARAQSARAQSALVQPEVGEGLAAILDRAAAGEALSEPDIVRMFAARGPEFELVCAAADRLRREMCGDTVSYVVTRNINYTNICYFRCQFCAFSKGKLSDNLRGRPYDLDHGEIVRRCEEAWERGATEVCLQGGIHPEYTGATYLAICRAIKQAVPGLHVHAFSPLEIWQGAKTLGRSLDDFLAELHAAGLASLPGTAAEILDDEIRAIICPDKVKTGEWLDVMRAAHRVGLRSTVTIMYGHVERYEHWARHLLRIRALQKETGGFTEFVPLPFVPMETPISLRGRSRLGPTWREALLMHAVARLALHPLIPNIQTSWVKLGPDGAAACLKAGANDLGGTLMNESISRAAGASHGQEMPPEAMEALIRSLSRTPRQRTTLYGDASAERRAAAFDAAPLSEPINTPAHKYERRPTAVSAAAP
ncbi:MAG: 5-amino-6-(D-ribitylamino)uracil--L-tyrosine 4-hydroxyphenyl transferase CofH [Alphaproteobacteria bacterium]|nr:5-amino-6-(D-ribitylamino)uracil--L-tyrosine 4-hydroxyphenyl transferase CofH [Alphaproteobacteria bacterium]